MVKSTKSGLGRGINSLLGTYDEVTIQERTPQKEKQKTISEKPLEIVAEENIEIKEVIERNLSEVSINQIVPNPDQPRTNFKKEDLEELSASIEKHGLLQPIVVRPIENNKYQIIAGERRWQACKKLGIKRVPIRIRETNDDMALELALVENIQRTDLNPIEEAYGYRRLMERQKMTQAEVAQAVAKGRSTVANALRLLELPEKAQQFLFEEKITAGHARAILSVPTKEGRENLTQKVIEEKLSVRETEALARLFSGKVGNTQKSKRQPLPPVYKKVAKELKKVLDTNVKVRIANGKNKIEIEFKDEKDLERLFSQITKERENTVC